MHEYPQKDFYRLSEVCQYTDTQPYVLQFWASEFPQLNPQTTGTGQPVYSRDDIELVLRIKQLLNEEEYTIEGARRQLDLELGAPDEAAGARTESASRARRPALPPEPPVETSSEPESRETRPALEGAQVLEFGSVSRERYDDAVDEIAHLRLRLQEAEALLRKSESSSTRSEERAQRYRERCERAARKLEDLLDRLA